MKNGHVAPAAAVSDGTGRGEQNQFLLVVLTFQRARQLQRGAKPRVNVDGHKSLWVARREVSAGMISWEAAQAAVPNTPKIESA
jgi:DNA-directed RNA polymerase omega subunit